MYQKCPVCDGSGYATMPYGLGESICPTCSGARIIDESTGLPPESQIPKIVTSTTLKLTFDEIENMPHTKTKS